MMMAGETVMSRPRLLRHARAALPLVDMRRQVDQDITQRSIDIETEQNSCYAAITITNEDASLVSATALPVSRRLSVSLAPLKTSGYTPLPELLGLEHL